MLNSQEPGNEEPKNPRFSMVGIKIQNFRGMQDVELEFLDEFKQPLKVFTVIGKKGTGKTTLIRAIRWCGYGSTAYTGPLSPTEILPSNWQGQLKQDQSVTIRFRTNSESGSIEKEYQCQRIREKGSLGAQTKTKLLIDGEEITDNARKKSTFKQIFGDPPQMTEGTMWVISPEEMKRVADSLGKEKKDYFLDFMNLNPASDALARLNRIYNKRAEEKAKAKKNKKQHQDHLTATRKAWSDQKQKVENIGEERQKLFTQITGKNQPSEEEKKIAKSSDDYSKAKIKLTQDELALHKAQFSAADMERMVNALIFSSLKRHGMDIPESFESEKFDWEAIADYCEHSGKFEESTIQTLRGFGGGLGIDTSNLTKNNSDLSVKMPKLKDAITQYYDTKSTVEDFENSGINEKSVSNAVEKNKQWEDAKNKWDKLGIELEKEKENLKSKKSAYDHASSLVQTSDDAAVDEKKLLRLESISQAIREAIKTTDEDYKDLMYNETLSRLTEYWEQIDDQDRYKPAYVDGEICLKSLHDNTIRDIDFKTSGGEGELLLVCACLALAEKSGAKMPIILDDCFTRNEPEAREKMIQVVCEVFDSMIYITNDDKMKDHMSAVSKGTLRFYPFVDDEWSKHEWEAA